MSNVLVQTIATFHTPQWGIIAHLKVYTPDYKCLSWLQVWQAFIAVYPGRWAMELYPPAGDLVNDAHVYHLWLLPVGWRPPSPMNLATKYRG